jgi:hypothetical protein
MRGTLGIKQLQKHQHFAGLLVSPKKPLHAL